VVRKRNSGTKRKVESHERTDKTRLTACGAGDSRDRSRRTHERREQLVDTAL